MWLVLQDVAGAPLLELQDVAGARGCGWRLQDLAGDPER